MEWSKRRWGTRLPGCSDADGTHAILGGPRLVGRSRKRMILHPQLPICTDGSADFGNM